MAQVKKIDETTTIVQPCHIDDKRLTNASWTTQEGKFGKYDSIILSPDMQSLANVILQYGNEKHYIYDLHSEYKFQLHDKWVNRYKKNRGELATTAELLQELELMGQPQQASVTIQEARIDSANDTPEIKEAKITSALRTEAWRVAHDDNMESQKATRQSIDSLTGEIRELNKILRIKFRGNENIDAET